MDGLVAIVAVEGPVEGHRLHTAYVKAAGVQRVGKSVAKTLNIAITAAVRQGKLLVDNPLHQSGVKPRTYRLPDQAETRVRYLGPRSLEQVPPRELAELITRAADEHGWDNNETLFRTVLARLGLHRLTTNVEARCSLCFRSLAGRAMPISSRVAAAPAPATLDADISRYPRQRTEKGNAHACCTGPRGGGP